MRNLVLKVGFGFLAATIASTAFAADNLTMWYHGAGNKKEVAVLDKIIADFNASQTKWHVQLENFPQLAYAKAVAAAASSGKLPDILDVDGSIMPNWAWAGYLAPLTMDEQRLAAFLPTTVGRWNGALYSIGMFDATTLFYARRSVLNKYNIRVATMDKPWTKDEFDDALAKLKESGQFKYVLQMRMNNRSEWFSYGFNTFLISFGGDLIDRKTYKTADGFLNGETAVNWGKWFQSLFKKGYSPATDENPADFATGLNSGANALEWYGSWMYDSHKKALGNDLVMMPPPDMGHGPKTGAGSWQFGISAQSKHEDGSAAFLNFATQDKYIAAFSDATGLIPATKGAMALTHGNYKQGGGLSFLFDYMKRFAVSRPLTPAYATISQQFNNVVANISNGADVQDTLDTAVDAIDADLKRNNDYNEK